MTREGVLVEYTIRGGRTSLSTLKRWEATGNPNLDDLVLLADVYGLTVAQLIGDEPLDRQARRPLARRVLRVGLLDDAGGEVGVVA